MSEMRGYRFGGLGQGRALGGLGPRVKPDPPVPGEEYETVTYPDDAAAARMADAVIDELGRQAGDLIAQGKIPMVVETMTPSQRAGMTLSRTSKATIAAFLVVIIPVWTGFLIAGDYSTQTVIAGLVVPTLTAILSVGLAWAMKFKEAADEQAQAS